MKKKHLNILLVATFFSSTLALFGPLQIYFTNVLEFNPSFSEIIFYLVPLFLLSLSLIFLCLFFLKGKVFEKASSVVFILSFLLWLQGNILVWNYGLLDGQTIDWGAKWYLGIIDGGVWLAFIIFALIKSSLINKISSRLSAALILIQLINVTFFAYKNITSYSLKSYSIDETNKFKYSAKQNVIIFILDGFQTDIFHELIDEESSYRDMFDGFIYFRNALSGYPSTYPTIPLILTGQFYDNSIPIQDFIKKTYLSETSLPKILKKHNFVVDLYPWIKQAVYFDKKVFSNFLKGQHRIWNKSELLYLYDITLFRHLPHFLKRMVYNNQLWFLKSLLSDIVDSILTKKVVLQEKADVKREHLFSEDAINKLQDLRFIDDMVQFSEVDDVPSSVFKYYHFLGIHVPIIMNENLEFQNLETNRTNYKKCAMGVLKYTHIFLEKLKELGIYDNSLLLIIGDHGGYTPVEYRNNNKLKQFLTNNINSSNLPPRKSLALPLILVKPLGRRGNIEISDAPVSLSDIPKTILSELNINNNDNIPGESMFDIKESSNRNRKFYFFYSSTWDNKFLKKMTEYEVKGFSWFDESWTKTGKEFSPGESIGDFYKEFMAANKFFGSPRVYTQSKNVKPVTSQLIEGWGKDATTTFQLSFPNSDPEHGDYIGLSVPINRLKRGSPYRIKFEIFDGYNNVFPGRFEHTVYINRQEIYKHDPAGDEFAGWKLVDYAFVPDWGQVELNIEVKATGTPEKGWRWGNAARIGIRNIVIDDVFKEFIANNKFLGSPKFYTQSRNVNPIISQMIERGGNESYEALKLSFPSKDPKHRDYIGLFVPIIHLKKGTPYKIHLEIFDEYGHVHPGRFEQVVYLDAKEIYKNDLAGDKFKGWKEVEYTFTPEAKQVKLNIEVKATGTPEKNWKWGKAATIGIRNIAIEEQP